MSVAIGGSIESLTIDGHYFAVAADAEANRKAEGWENEIQSNGDGTGRLIKTRTAWSLSGVEVEVNDTEDAGQFLQDSADRKELVPFTITMASGLTYQGDGQIVEGIEISSQKATASITIQGSGKLTRQ